MKQIINKIREIFKLQPTCSQVHQDCPMGESNREKKIKKIENDYASILAEMQKIIDNRSKKDEDKTKIITQDTVNENQDSSVQFRGEAF